MVGFPPFFFCIFTGEYVPPTWPSKFIARMMIIHWNGSVILHISNTGFQDVQGWSDPVDTGWWLVEALLPSKSWGSPYPLGNSGRHALGGEVDDPLEHFQTRCLSDFSGIIPNISKYLKKNTWKQWWIFRAKIAKSMRIELVYEEFYHLVCWKIKQQ